MNTHNERENLIPKIAELLGMEIGEEFYIPKISKKPYIILEDGIHRSTETGYSDSLEAIILNYLLNGKVSFKKKKWEPKDGQEFIYPDVSKKSIMWGIWCNASSNLALKSLGMVYRTKEEAQINFASDYKKLTGKELENG